MTPGPGIEPGTHWWEASALTTAPSLLPSRSSRVFAWTLLLKLVIIVRSCAQHPNLITVVHNSLTPYVSSISLFFISKGVDQSGGGCVINPIKWRHKKKTPHDRISDRHNRNHRIQRADLDSFLLALVKRIYMCHFCKLSVVI